MNLHLSNFRLFCLKISQEKQDRVEFHKPPPLRPPRPDLHRLKTLTDPDLDTRDRDLDTRDPDLSLS